MKRFALLLLLGCVVAMAAPAQARLLVAVSIEPQAYFLQQIAGDRVEALVMVPAGANAHTYEPKPRQLAALSKAAIYCGIGVDFEGAWLPRFAAVNPKMAIVHTDAGIEKMPMLAHDHEHEGHGQEHAVAHEAHTGHHHEAGEPDPHVWLSPRLAKVLGASMRDALIAADPAGTEAYKAGYARFAASCDMLQADIQKLFAALPPGPHKFMVFHPSWGYFARDFGLTQVPIEQLGREPGPRALAGLVREAKQDGVKVIFVQPQMDASQAKTLAAAIGGRVAVVNPLAEDWAANLLSVAKTLRQGLVGAGEGK